jgi:hypothetical protein
VEQNGESVYDKVLEEHNLLEEAFVQLVNERSYKNYGSFECFQYTNFSII